MTGATMTTATQTRAPSVREVAIGLPRPHSAGQRELITYPGSVALFAGGRYGKTEAGVRRIVRAMIQEPDLYYWVGLSWKSASLKKAWRMLHGYWRTAISAAGLNPQSYINRSDHEIRVPGTNALLMFRSAENPDSIAGDGPAGVVGDEFTYWPEELWGRFLQPSLADKNGWAFLMGRPFGRNWAANVWERAADRQGWIQRHYTIYDNPLLSRDVIEDLRQNTIDDVWRQEYLAECFDGVSSVFRNVDAVSVLASASPEAGHRYIMGVDLALTTDYTCVTVLDVTDAGNPRQVYIDRWHGIPWHHQLDRVEELARAYHPDMIEVDKTGVGDMPFDELATRLDGLNVWGVTFNAGNKLDMVQSLALALEKQRVLLLDDTVQKGELKSYAATRKPSGVWSYSAPAGMHDDTVAALMLAYDAATAEGWGVAEL